MHNKDFRPELSANPETSGGATGAALHGAGKPDEGVGSYPAAGPAEILVAFRDVYKRFPRADALKGVTLDLPPGQIVGLLGPNGSGKSTMLKLMVGLHRPTSGTVSVSGRTPDRATKAQVAYLPEVDHLYGWMTVKETIRFVRGFYEDWDDERARALLDFMNLDSGKKVAHLSKGMRARLKLVLALARSARLVLLDEPLSGIDPPSRSRIVQAILSEYRFGEQTIVLSTHEVLEAESLFDRLIMLDEGGIRLDGDAEQLRREYGRSIQGIMEHIFA